MLAENWRIIDSPLGTLWLRIDNHRVTGLVIRSGEGAGAPPGRPGEGPAEPCVRQAVAELTEYFAGRRRQFGVPIAFTGCPPFTRRVLETLRSVPYGETLTYGELAARVGSPGAARAVGRAMALNPLPIIVPCHRVIAANGRLGGYSGGQGLPTKKWLLAFEQRNRSGNLADFKEKSA